MPSSPSNSASASWSIERLRSPLHLTFSLFLSKEPTFVSSPLSPRYFWFFFIITSSRFEIGHEAENLMPCHCRYHVNLVDPQVCDQAVFRCFVSTGIWNIWNIDNQQERTKLKNQATLEVRALVFPGVVNFRESLVEASWLQRPVAMVMNVPFQNLFPRCPPAPLQFRCRGCCPAHHVD